MPEPAALFSSLMIGLIGFGYFSYGKKGKQPIPLGAGLLMMATPYFVDAIWLEWLITAGLAGGTYVALRYGY